ncbi:hypothetical protein [Bacillus sp. MRMR6]|uniref:hypothetical protein n=1 Tax=Bacillus sp. MRMR6 TaxID=1928617 RepID=UPI000950BF5E|nr:hypothetical protein [Bacillus sp. MRMR6]OLS40367.1 hypothetical protein BTR25_09410 [Bacillus sp. MRMR6]
MVVEHARLEKSNLTKYVPPKGEFEAFRDEEHYKEKLKEWGLSSARHEFLFKERNYKRGVTIIGYESYGKSDEYNTLVIEFQDGNISCIHPAYLKEMQQSSFGKESLIQTEEKESDSTEAAVDTTPVKVEKQEKTPAVKAPKVPKPKKDKPVKIALPADKVHFTATVKQFALSYNPFNEANDEVVILENVQIVQEQPIDLDFAWCSHSKTLKKFELTAGDSLEFDGKVASKKLPKGKDVPEEYTLEVAVLYKVNNPSKLVKK